MKKYFVLAALFSPAALACDFNTTNQVADQTVNAAAVAQGASSYYLNDSSPYFVGAKETYVGDMFSYYFLDRNGKPTLGVVTVADKDCSSSITGTAPVVRQEYPSANDPAPSTEPNPPLCVNHDYDDSEPDQTADGFANAFAYADGAKTYSITPAFPIYRKGRVVAVLYAFLVQAAAGYYELGTQSVDLADCSGGGGLIQVKPMTTRP
jgi:hypothetical protein